jgi:hypothetical protein
VLDRDVAVKMLTGLTMGHSGRARFEDEGQTLARLSHPGLITLSTRERRRTARTW